MKPIGAPWLCVAVLGAVSCQKSSETSSAAAASVTASATPPSAPPATGSSGATMKCPLPKRCAAACRGAFDKALSACAKEGDAMVSSMGKAAADAFGKCNAACITNKDHCIGSATTTECQCVEACEKNVPPAARAKYDGYTRCMAGAAAACD
jgi:hypothetical protein